MKITKQISVYYNRNLLNRLFSRYIIITLLIVFSTFSALEGQPSGHSKGRNPEKALFGKSRKIKSKSKKTREPRKVTKAKKAAEKKQLKIKQDYFNYVDKSKKRAFQIQSPAVQSRMRQNQKDITDREKEKKKNRSSATRRGASKYKK